MEAFLDLFEKNQQAIFMVLFCTVLLIGVIRWVPSLKNWTRHSPSYWSTMNVCTSEPVTR